MLLAAWAAGCDCKRGLGGGGGLGLGKLTRVELPCALALLRQESTFSALIANSRIDIWALCFEVGDPEEEALMYAVGLPLGEDVLPSMYSMR